MAFARKASSKHVFRQAPASAACESQASLRSRLWVFGLVFSWLRWTVWRFELFFAAGGLEC
jgi:hypothetical protein